MIETKSAGGVVLNTTGEVLVVSQHGTSWSLPKGHIEDDEDAMTAARRETEEESHSFFTIRKYSGFGYVECRFC
jgi:8-oxo-dGTP pyrophosphatase MutT (NUDIX family)